MPSYAADFLAASFLTLRIDIKNIWFKLAVALRSTGKML